MHHRRRSTATLAICLALCSVPALVGGTTAEAATPRVATLRALAAAPRDAVRLGAAAPLATMHLSIGLAPRDPEALSAFVASVSDPSSPAYRHFLAPGQYAVRFGATTASVAPLRSSLEAAGLHVAPSARGDQVLHVTGTVDAVERYFHIRVDRYRASDGRLGIVGVGRPTVPFGVRPVIAGITGFDTIAAWTNSARAHATRRLPAKVRPLGTAPSCTAASTAQASAIGGWTTTQLAQAYGFSAAYDRGAFGAGVTVGLYELAAYQPSDIAAYDSCFKITPSLKVVDVDGGAGAYDPSTASEPTLDVEEMLSLAPQANFLVYEGPNDSGNGPNDLLSRIASDDKAMVVSTSWGICESLDPDPNGVGWENTVFQQMAAQGQTMVAASGDNGTADCYDGSNVGPTPQVDDPASQPDVTGVGATSLGSLSPLRQSTWSSNSLAGGATGGGYSTIWPRPSWQTVSTLNPLSASTMRMVPDVAMSGDPNKGVVIYGADLGGWTTIGGTSASSPLFASMLTLAESNCGITTTGLGSINPKLYSIAQSLPSAFSDVTSGTNAVTTDGSIPSYAAGPGYDLASGLGSPVASFFGAICSSAPVASLTSLKAGNETSVTVTATTPSTLSNGDHLTLTLPTGDTVPSSYAALTATANGSPVPMSATSEGSSTASTTANMVTFTCYATIPAGSTLTFTIANVLNRLSTLASSVTVSSSADGWTTMAAALPALSTSTPLWKATDLASHAPVAASAAGPGVLLTSATGTTATVVTATKSSQLALLAGTTPNLTGGVATLKTLPKAAGKVTGALSAFKNGATTTVAVTTSTGHLLLVIGTSGRWSFQDLTTTAKASTVKGAPCAVPVTVGSTVGTAVFTRTSTSKLQVSVVAGGIAATTNLTAATAIGALGPPACVVTPVGSHLSANVAVRAPSDHLVDLDVRFGASPTIVATSSNDITAEDHLPPITADPAAVSLSGAVLSIASTVANPSITGTAIVLSIAGFGTHGAWSSVNLTNASSLPASLVDPIVLSTTDRSEIVARNVATGGLELIVNNGPLGLWNGYVLSAAFGLPTLPTSFEAAAAGATTAVTWISPTGHQVLASSSTPL